ncbi:MAG TPA: TIGR03790 family protein [Kiritimatiellia bacterium]|nr:TIGR03790 family protein [Kiritimatiellia bacterium]
MSAGYRLIAAAVFVANGMLAGVGWTGPERTVVVANRNVPESLDLAAYYMERRGIPEAHLVALDLPVSETMTRWHYHHRLREPLLAQLRELGLIDQVKRQEKQVGRHDSGWRTVRADVRYVVSMRGVPLRIADTKPFSLARLSTLLASPGLHNGAAVDSELALALFDTYEIDGPYMNPQYGTLLGHTAMLPSRHILIAARLDGPDAGTVRRMIDDSLWAEQNGVHGRGYFDLRGIQDASFYRGDYWIWEARERLAREGFETVTEGSPEVFPAGYPMERPAFYFGWYEEHVTGPFTREDFRFARGAIAYHLHSFGARKLRDGGLHWAGPLLAKGAAATFGAIDEPFLNYTPDLQLFMSHLCLGFPFGDSLYGALPALSWHITVVGDPLYRPMGVSVDGLRDKAEELGADEVAWVLVRRANLLLRQGQFAGAIDLLWRNIVETRHPILREKLADLHAMNQNVESAIGEYEGLAREATTAERAVRNAAKWLEMMRATGRDPEGARLIEAVREAWAGHPTVEFLR